MDFFNRLFGGDNNKGADDEQYDDSRVERGPIKVWIVYLKKPVDDDGYPVNFLSVDATSAVIAREKAVNILKNAGMSEKNARGNIKSIVGDLGNRPDSMRS